MLVEYSAFFEYIYIYIYMYITIIYLTNLVCTMTEDAQESRLGGGGAVLVHLIFPGECHIQHVVLSIILNNFRKLPSILM